jgi:hypothetical protein
VYLRTAQQPHSDLTPAGGSVLDRYGAYSGTFAHTPSPWMGVQWMSCGIGMRATRCYGLGYVDLTCEQTQRQNKHYPRKIRGGVDFVHTRRRDNCYSELHKMKGGEQFLPPGAASGCLRARPDGA